MKNNNNSIKGAKLRQMGYPTSIHALPSEVREKVDSLLLSSVSVPDLMKQVSSLYPQLNIPSRSAFYNYKRKYINQTSNDKLIELQDLPIKPVLLEHIKRFLAYDIPTLRENYCQALERNKQNPTNKDVKDSAKLYFEGFKLALESVNRLNLYFDDTDVDSDNETDSESLALEGKMTEIVSKYGKELLIASRNTST